MHQSIFFAIMAALLFGASTPFAKLLINEASPMMLGGMLYLGSGIGLGIARLIRDRGWKSTGMATKEWPWLLGAIVFGGVFGPVALMYGLAHASGASASLMLNLEAVLTAVIAWVVFRENADRRVVLGMVAIVAGGVVLSWPNAGMGSTDGIGPMAIALACLCWAIDNNLTRKVSASDALFIAGSKGLIAGAVNCTLAFISGSAFPPLATMGSIMLLGLLGYGVSLVMFVLALRGLGTSRTGAYFSTAPFIGALIALALLHEPVTSAFWLASLLMGLGVWLHLTERHEHLHTHDPQEHRHPHRHDEHHQHEHDFEWDGQEPHSHQHAHTVVTHKHPHFPDIHHRHAH